MNKINDIWTDSACLSQSQLIGYIRQTLDREEVYVVETHLSSCPFCSDALEGLMETDMDETESLLLSMKKGMTETLSKQVQIQQGENIVPKMTVHSSSGNGGFLKNGKIRWSLAAGILFMIALGGYSVFSYIRHYREELALHKGEGKSSTETAYKQPDDREAGEIIHLEVKPDSFSEPVEKKAEKSVAKGFAKEPMKGTRTEEPLTTSAPPAIAEESKMQTEVAENKPETVKDEIANNYEKETPVGNYMQNEKQKAVVQKSISKKSSSGGLSRNQNFNTQAPAANQMSYPRNNNDNNLQENYSGIQQSASKYNNNLSEEDVDTDNYQRGIELYNKGNYKRAIRLLERALKNPGGIDTDDIRYYLAQAYLKTGKTKEAEDLLTILSANSKYKKSATEQLQRSKK
ncbi:MAG: tetratricopeptide repeat protein [Chitinophagaceae bacterium]|nr:tetratricopeptide repeat protein [Chitinophagaceae bacterium]